MSSSSDQRRILKAEGFTVVTSNVGGSIISITPDGYPSITRDVDAPIVHGRQAGLFCCGQIFGRLLGRNLRFDSRTYEMPYSPSMDAAAVDPDRLYLHGLDYLLTFEEESVSNNRVVYVRPRSALPEDYPFPHQLRIEYHLGRKALTINILVEEVDRTTPICPTVHPFFKYFLSSDTTRGPELQARLKECFDYSVTAKLPIPESPPTPLADDGPFRVSRKLPVNLDHSFISTDGCAVVSWPDGPRILMHDTTPDTFSKVRPIHLWTTAAEARNLFGVEHGGPANIFGMVEDGAAPPDYLMVVSPGQTLGRRVCYELL